jgi:diadenylate cyclase
MDFQSLSATRLFPLVVKAIDIGIVWYLVYRGLLVIRGTRAVPMLLGLALIAVVYFVAQPLGLTTLAWIIDNFLSSIILVIVVIFQDEIRRTLTKVGVQPFLFKNARLDAPNMFEEISIAVSRLAKAKLGSIVVLEREVGLDEFIEKGVVLDARLSRKLLYSIFVKETPLHDGAVIVQRGTIKAAGCVLPLSSNPDLDPGFGTRHRAAVGLTERSDAMVIVVSEESGSITLFIDGKQYRNLDAVALQALLESHSNQRSQRKGAEGRPVL